MFEGSIPGLEAFLTPAPLPAQDDTPAPSESLPARDDNPVLAPVDLAGAPVIGPLIAELVPVPLEPPPPAPAKPKNKGGRPKTPWLVRAEKEREEPEETLEDIIVQMALDPEGAKKLDALLAAEHAYGVFAEFFRQAWKVLEPSTDLLWNWHLQLICNVLQALFMDWLKAKRDRKYINRIQNVIFNVPPGSSKSRIIAVCFQAWCWLHWPGMKFIALSVNDDAMMRDARATRELIRSTWYIDSFKPQWHVKGDQDAVSNYGNTVGGERVSMAMKSEIVGLRADCVAGETLVATERGDVTIRDLHGAAERGEHVPLVWSRSAIGALELRPVVATRKVEDRETVVVRTDADQLLQCTPDHRIFTQGDYTPAAHLAGRGVSVLRWSDLSVSSRYTAALPRVSVRDAYVRTMLDGVHASRCGARQGCETGESRPVLQQGVLAEQPTTTGGNASVRSLRECVHTERQGARHALSRVRIGLASEDAYAGRSGVRALLDDVRADVISNDVLQQGVRECGALGADDRSGQFELLGTSVDLQRRTLGQPRASDSGTRWEQVHRVRSGSHLERAGIGSPSRRPQSDEQRAGEPDHGLRCVSHGAPQIEDATVLSVDSPVIHGRDSSIDVYDIQVDGNHNFFANGVLVHNCILVDDPNNPKKSESKNERDAVNDLWDTNQANRVNDMQRSLRIGVQQRTNAGDWTGHVIDQMGTWSEVETETTGPDGWLHVVLPAEFDPERKFVMPECLQALLREYLPPEELVLQDLRTEEGKTLDETRLPDSVLAKEKKRWEGTGNYAGQMQQSPATQGGQIVQDQWWGWYRLARGVKPEIDELESGRERPGFCHKGAAQVVHVATHRPGNWDFDWITISVDPAAKKTEKGSNYGLLAIAGKGGRRYVLDDRTRKARFIEIVEEIKSMVRMWGPDTILIEPKAAGPDIMDTLREQMATGDCPMVAIEEAEPGNSDKEMRLEAALPYIKNGMVMLLDGAPWLKEFVKELNLFPNGLNDDRVDALSQCLNHKRKGNDDWPTL